MTSGATSDVTNDVRGRPRTNACVTDSWTCGTLMRLASGLPARRNLPRAGLGERRPAARTKTSSGRRRRRDLFTLFVVLLCCCSFSTCQRSYPLRITDPRVGAPEHVRLSLRALAESSTILVDQQPPPLKALWTLQPGRFHDDFLLGKRQGSGSDPFASSSDASSSSPSPSPSASPTVSATVAPSSTGDHGASATQSSNAIPLPSPFDSFLDTNFTAPSCPQFIHAFLANATFKSCLPFSLLLTSSVSFFQASKSVFRVTQTLDATCAANATSCASLMSSIASNLILSSNCGVDYGASNPVVIEAYTGLIAYKPLYEASCLKNPATSAYCYASAITNASSPTDAYIYTLPLNQSLPGSSQPTCNTCLQNTMAVFDAAAVNRSQPIASTYVNAAQQINMRCGPNFVNASLPAPLGSDASRGIGNSAVGLAVLLMILGNLIF